MKKLQNYQDNQKNSNIILMSESQDEDQPFQIVQFPENKIFKIPEHKIYQYDSDEEKRPMICIAIKNFYLVLPYEDYKPKVLNQQQWHTCLQKKEIIQNQLCDIDIFYSIMYGLDAKVKKFFWNNRCKVSSIKVYNHVSQNNQKYNEQIRKCLNATNNLMSQIGVSEAKFNFCRRKSEEVLVQYYKIDPEVGFSRGMQYIIMGIMLSFIDQYQQQDKIYQNILDYFVHFIKKVQLRDMFFPGWPGIFPKVKQLKKTLQIELKSVYTRICHEDTQFHEIFYKYYLTLFIYNIPKKSFIERILELILLQGWKYITYLLVTLLQLNKDILITFSSKKLIKYLKNDILHDFIGDKCSDQQALTKFENLLIKREKFTA